jgi:hypothetical protein
MLDDIVSELWRKENVTSGYCPRYRYTLIATLTLGNLYYICVCIFFQHHQSFPSRMMQFAINGSSILIFPCIPVVLVDSIMVKRS